jgi:hypothetical protein
VLQFDCVRAHGFNLILSSWVAYYGRFYPSAMYPVFMYVNKMLVAGPPQGLVGWPIGTILSIGALQTTPVKRPQVLRNASRSALSWSLCV